jgi:hypothetical protein
MALTQQKILDAEADLEDLGAIVNGDENTDVVTRTGGTIPSLRKRLAALPFPVSSADLEAAVAPKADSADVAAALADKADAAATAAALDGKVDEATLGSDAGAAAVGFKNAGVGAVSRTADAKLKDAALSPLDFGCVGDGVTDDTANLAKARDAAAAAGKWLDGGGRIYAVTGRFDIKNDNWWRDITLRQKTPGLPGGDCTLYIDTKSNVRLVRVAVDKNGDGTNGGAGANAAFGPNGYMNQSNAISIIDPMNCRFEDLEVYGNDTGTGINFKGLTHTTTVLRPRVHDMLGINSTAADENICGIQFQFCIGCTVYDPRVSNLRMTYNGGATTNNQYTRGIGYSGCENFTVVGAQLNGCSEAHDVSSSFTNSGVVILGGSVSDCYTWGVKFANYAKRCKAIGVEAVRCAMAGFTDSSSFDVQGVNRRDRNLFENCTARDCGDPARFSNAAGFAFLTGTHTYTNGAVARDCVAVDERGPALMKYGFYNEKAASANALASFPGCQSVGHTTAAFQGEHEDRAHVTLNSAAQSIPNNAATEVLWDTDLEDTSDLHSTSSSQGRVVTKIDGIWLITVRVQWAGNATGNRKIAIQKNGGNFPGAIQDTAGQAANHTQTFQYVTPRVPAGTSLGVAVTQTSGAALNIIANSNQSGLLIQRIG